MLNSYIIYTAKLRYYESWVLFLGHREQDGERAVTDHREGIYSSAENVSNDYY